MGRERAASPEIALSFRGVSKTFIDGTKQVDALAPTSLDVYTGDFVALVGPSGCGKSTLMNIVAGLLAPTNGDVHVHGSPLRGPTRGVGYVTQKDNLLPWRTVQGNVELGLEIDGIDRAERPDLARAALQRVGLGGFEDSYPRQLSGGMRQRVNIARTVARDPKLILMDEPFGSLDAITRGTLQNHLMGLWTANQTILFVTHDLVEAIALSDRVIVMSSRPGHIKADVTVNLPRPRDAFSVVSAPGFAALHERIWDELAGELEGRPGVANPIEARSNA